MQRFATAPTCIRCAGSDLRSSALQRKHTRAKSRRNHVVVKQQRSQGGYSFGKRRTELFWGPHGADMFTFKKMALASAVSLLGINGLQAADLPVKAKAVEYVRICSLYGAGFFYIPGTDTCIKLGGYLRADVTFNGSIHGAPAWSGDLAAEPLSRLLRRALPHGADRRYPHRHRVRRGPHLWAGRLPVQQPRPATTSIRSISRDRRASAPIPACFNGRAAATSRSSTSSSSSPVSPLASPPPPMQRLGRVSRATSIRACSAVKTPIPASTNPVHRSSSAMA